MTNWRDERRGAEAIVREGEEAFAWCREQIEQHGPIDCWVQLPGSGERCSETAVMEVYDFPFCEAHGAEAKAGALEELYDDACQSLERFDVEPMSSLPAMNAEALGVIRAGVSELVGASLEALRDGDAALRRAYPFRPDLMDEDFRDFDYAGGERMREPYSLPVDWCRRHRMVVHKLMRIAFEGEADYVLADLEEEREHLAAQLAYVLADSESRRPSLA